MQELKKFTFYWDNGKREVVESTSVMEALAQVGYPESITRLAFYTPDENRDFSFDEETRTWKLFSHVIWQDVDSN